MVKMYHALGVVALVALVGLALNAAYLRWWPTPYPNPSSGLDGTILFDLLSYWQLTVVLFAPMVSTFAVIVAAQSRDRTWLLILLVSGFLGWYGVQALLLLLHAVPLGAAVPSALLFVLYKYGLTAFWAVPALVALMFVWRKLRASAPTAQAG